MTASAPLPQYPYRELRALMTGDSPSEFDRSSVARLVGDRLLAYVTNASPEQVDLHLKGGDVLSASQRAALDTSLKFASLAIDVRRESASNDDRPPGPREPIYDALAALFNSPALNQRMSFADALRMFAGGTPAPPPPAEDPFVAFLLRVAAASVGGLLVERTPEDGPWFYPRPPVARPNDDVLARLLSEDAAMRPLFPDVQDAFSPSARFLDTTGRGGVVQVAFVPELIIGAAAARAGWPNRLRVKAFLAVVPVAINEVRRLAAGETVEVPAWVDFVGRNAPVDMVVRTALGDLSCPPTASDVAPPTGGLIPALRLSTSFPLALDLSFGANPDGHSETWESGQREFRRRIDHVRLAFLLARDGPDPLSLQLAQHEVSNPLNWSGTVSPWSVPPFSLPLEPTEAERVVRWAALIAAHHHPSIDLGVRRALSATTPGRDMEDRLVDAVIALENLIGDGTGMRPSRAFSMGVTALAGSGGDDRAAIATRANEIYRARSGIVHGRAQLRLHELSALMRDAIRLLLDGLKFLFGQVPELIVDRRRGRRLASIAEALPAADDRMD